MKRFFYSMLFLVLILALGYFVLDKYYPDGLIPLKQAWRIAEEKMGLKTTDEQFVMVINRDLDSNLAAIIKQPRTNQGLAIFTEKMAGTEFITDLVLTGEGEGSAHIKVGQNGLPSSLQVDDYLVLFDNYRSKKVDITVRLPDRTYQYFPGETINWPEQPTAWLPIPAAQAEDFRIELPGEKESRADGSFTEYLTSAPGTVLNIVSCTAALASLLPSFGSSGPLAWLSCGVLATRVITTPTNIMGCEGDIVRCGTTAIKDLIVEEIVESTFDQEFEESEDYLSEDEENFYDEEDDSEDNFIEDLLTVEEDDDSDELEVFDHDYTATFSHSMVGEHGLTQTDDGMLSVSFDGTTSICVLNADTSISGIPNTPTGSPTGVTLPSVSMEAESVSTVCTGTIDLETGNFELEGATNTDLKAQTGQLGEITTSGIGAFHVLGTIDKGRMSGTIFFSNKALELIPYEQ